MTFLLFLNDHFIFLCIILSYVFSQMFLKQMLLSAVGMNTCTDYLLIWAHFSNYKSALICEYSTTLLCLRAQTWEELVVVRCVVSGLELLVKVTLNGPC